MIRLGQHEPLLRSLEPRRSEEGFSDVLRAAGRAAADRYSPEDQRRLAAFLEVRDPATYLPVAESAGLADLEARWLHRLLMVGPQQSNATAQLSRLLQLQKRRMQFEELGRQLEEYARELPPGQRDGVLQEAASAYRAAGNAQAELRLRHEGPRFYELLLAMDPQRLAVLSGPGQYRHADARSGAAGAALSGGVALARQAITARGTGLPLVWTRAYLGLIGLYFNDPAPGVNTAFQEALGGGTIGERLGKPVDRNQQLAGDLWFYYGSRYGEYLDLRRAPNFEDYLPAMLEARPGRAHGYLTIAEFYRDTQRANDALAEYSRALDLDPWLPAAHEGMAEIHWAAGRRDAAIEQWKAALAKYAAINDRGRAPEDFWTTLPALLERIGRLRVFPGLRDDADKVLRPYIRRNGVYRVEPLLRGALAAGGEPAAGVAWMLDLARAAPDSRGFLGNIVDQEWLPDTLRGAVFDRLLALSEERVAAARGEAQVFEKTNLREWRLRFIAHLLKMKLAREAQAALDALEPGSDVYPFELRAAAQTGALERLLDRYRREPDKAPAGEALRSTAVTLRGENQAAAARRVLEFAYLRDLDQQILTPETFLGLAEVRLESGEAPAAIGLLRRMNLVSGAPFENLTAAATLLERFGRRTEAMEFLAARVRAVPWDSQARDQMALWQGTRTTPPQPPATPETLAASPMADHLRPAVFRSLLNAGRPATAVAAMEPLLRGFRLEELDYGETDTDEGESWRDSPFLADLRLHDQQRAALAADLGRACHQLDRLRLAESFYTVAAALDPAHGNRLGAVGEERRRRAADAARRPVISVNLDQPRLVRPKIGGAP
jgi:tetratricopeptide (TPR) repeat protein